MEYKHIPVLLTEVLAGIDLKEGDKVVDCTLGGAGYTLEFSKRVGQTGKVYSFDLDKLATSNAEKLLKEQKIKNVILINDSFFNIESALKDLGEVGGFKAVVMDLGLSSAQLSDLSRGFSFQGDAPLDMTFGGEGGEFSITKDILKYKKEKDLEKLIRDYGEERHASAIAKAIVKARKEKPINRSGELRDIIKEAVPNAYVKHSKIHYATRTFQALRIASNDELNGLERTLPKALDLIRTGGRLAVVSFHSLEDRIVKNFFKSESKTCICPPELPICNCEHLPRIKVLSKKPIEAGNAELKANPRSRSAKLRVAEKINE